MGKCEGSMVKHWLKVNPMNRKFVEQLVNALADRIPNVIKSGRPGVLFAGPLTNLCTKFQDLEPEIKEEMDKLQEAHAAMSDGSGDPDTKGPFNAQTGNTQQYYMASNFLKSPFGA